MTIRSRPDGVLVLTNGIEPSKDGLTLFVNYPDNVRLLRFLGRDPTFDEVARWQVLCDAFRQDENRAAGAACARGSGRDARAGARGELFFGTNGLKDGRRRAPLPSAMEERLLALEWCVGDDRVCPECGFRDGWHDQDGCELGRMCAQIRAKRALAPLAGLTDHEIGALVLLYGYKYGPAPILLPSDRYAESRRGVEGDGAARTHDDRREGRSAGLRSDGRRTEGYPRASLQEGDDVTDRAADPLESIRRDVAKLTEHERDLLVDCKACGAKMGKECRGQAKEIVCFGRRVARLLALQGLGYVPPAPLRPSAPTKARKGRQS